VTRCRSLQAGVVPQPRLPREQQQEQLTRDLEIDPHKYYPPDVYREPLTKLPNSQLVDLRICASKLKAISVAVDVMAATPL
jgi:hypothetical protein